MIFTGTIYKSGKHWIAEIPAFEAITQANTKHEVFAMMEDWFKSMLTEPFKIRVMPLDSDKIAINIEANKEIFALLLRRQRIKSGLSIRDVAAILGMKSPNGYAAYENGDREPSLSLAAKLLKAVSKHDHIDIGFTACG